MYDMSIVSLLYSIFNCSFCLLIVLLTIHHFLFEYEIEFEVDLLTM